MASQKESIVQNRKTLVLGGAGFLGYHLALELAPHRQAVVLYGRGILPVQAVLPKTVTLIHGNLDSLSSEKLVELLGGFDEIIFAAGKDDRKWIKGSAWQLFFHENVTLLERVLVALRGLPVQSFVLYNSFFATAARKHPEWGLEKRHPYIASRLGQQALIEEHRPHLGELGITVLEIPFVMGALPGRPSLFVPLLKSLRRFPIMIVLDGSISLASAQDIALATKIALESPRGLGVLPITTFNLNWKEWIELILKEMQIARPVLILPKWLIQIAFTSYYYVLKWRGLEMGLDLRFLAMLLGQKLAVNQLQSPFDNRLNSVPESLKKSIQQMIQSESIT